MSDKLTKYKNEVIAFFVIASLYIYRTYKFIFPKNYQQDDISEMRVAFIDNFSCVINKGDNHPLFSIFIWIISKFFNNPEYIISSVVIFLTICSFFILYNIFKEQYSIEIATLSITVLLFSPAIITYSLSLKQYIFEFLATAYFIRILQLNLNSKKSHNFILKFCLTSSILILFSLVNIIPFVVTIILVFMFEKKINLKFILYPCLVLIPFLNIFYQKSQRISSSGYWQDFFITHDALSIQGFFSNFYFLNSLFIKSLIVENLAQITTLVYVLSLIAVYYTKDKLMICSLLGIGILYIMSILKLYPLGGERTDILFLPYLLLLIAGFTDFLYKNIRFKNRKYFIVSFILFYILNGLSTTEVFYKNELIQPIINNIEQKFNDNDTTLIVTGEQYPSFIYYSKNIVNSQTIKSKGCQQTRPYIRNLIVYDKNLYFYSSNHNLEISEEKILGRNNIVLVGIELPGTLGKYRSASQYILENGYSLKSKSFYENGLVSLEFIKDE